MEQNFTPLDPSMTIPSFEKEAPLKKKIRLDSIYLIFSVCIFVLSMGLFINSTRFTTTSDAKPIQNVPTAAPKKTVSSVFPKSYKNENIPLSIYDNLNNYPDIPAVDGEEYVKTQVMKFYVYKNILEQNNESSASALIPQSYRDIKDGLTVMEPIIEQNVLSKAYFGYIKARFAGAADASDLNKKYGDLQVKAENVIKRYQQMFVAGDYTAQQIIDVSNKDEELLMLNDREKNQFIDDYDATKKIFQDKKFDEFLFSQQENQLSDLYTLENGNSSPEAFIIVYPSKILKKKYNSIEKMIEEQAANFSY